MTSATTKQVMSYLAERGRIISNDDGAYLVMFDGYVQRYEPRTPDKGVQIVALRPEYALIFPSLAPQEDTSKELRPRERYISELHQSRPWTIDA